MKLFSKFTTAFSLGLIFSTLSAPVAQAYECSLSDYGVRPTKCLFYIPSSAKVRGEAARDQAVLHNSIELQIFHIPPYPGAPDAGFGNRDGQIYFRAVEHTSRNNSNDNCVGRNPITQRCGLNRSDFTDNKNDMYGDFHTIHNQMMATLGLPTVLSVGVPTGFLVMLKWLSRADQRVVNAEKARVAAAEAAAIAQAGTEILGGVVTSPAQVRLARQEVDFITRFAARTRIGAGLNHLFDNRVTRYVIDLYRPSVSPITRFGSYILWGVSLNYLSHGVGHVRDWVIQKFHFNRREDFITDLVAAFDHLERACPAGSAQQDVPLAIGNSPDSVRTLVDAPAGTPAVALLGALHAPGSPEAVQRAREIAATATQVCAKVATTDNLGKVRERLVAFFRDRNENYGVTGDIGFYRAATTDDNPELLEISNSSSSPSQQPAVTP